MPTRTSLADLPCSVARTLELVGDRWTLLVLRDAFHGRRRFAEFAENLPIARNVLAARLAGLVDAGLLEKVAYSQRPPRDEYRLTEAGRDLVGVVVALMAWGDRWLVPDGEPTPIGLVHTACGHDVHPQVVCDACGQELVAGDLRVRPHLGQAVPARVRAPDAVAGSAPADA